MIERGTEATVELIVGEDDTALALGSGDVPVLATPRVVALVEAAAVAAVAGRLGPGTTSVGTRIELDHLAPSRVGARVVGRAVVEEVDGRTVAFTVQVSEAGRVVARGRHVRVVVDRERFLH